MLHRMDWDWVHHYTGKYLMLLCGFLSPLFSENCEDKEVWPAVMSLPPRSDEQTTQTKPSFISTSPLLLLLFLAVTEIAAVRLELVQPSPSPTCTAAPTDAHRDGGWDTGELGGGRREKRTKATSGFCVTVFHRGDRGPRWYIPIEPSYKNLLPLTPIV